MKHDPLLISPSKINKGVSSTAVVSRLFSRQATTAINSKINKSNSKGNSNETSKNKHTKAKVEQDQH